MPKTQKVTFIPSLKTPFVRMGRERPRKKTAPPTGGAALLGTKITAVRPWIFITGNPFKAQQIAWHLKMPIYQRKIDISEIQSLNLKTIVEHKARQAYELLRQPVLVEDTSLRFAALGKLPGPLIKWFLEELTNEGICHLLDRYVDRTGIAETTFGLCQGRAVQIFTAKTHGTIAPRPRGKEGFGWDPIFIPKGHTKTWGEMTLEEQAKTSIRRRALQKVRRYLKEDSRKY